MISASVDKPYLLGREHNAEGNVLLRIAVRDTQVLARRPRRSRGAAAAETDSGLGHGQGHLRVAVIDEHNAPGGIREGVVGVGFGLFLTASFTF
jgi:hypothetical protein